MTVKAGFGTDTIHLGQQKSHLEAAFGQPGKKQVSSALREHWIYPSLGFEAVVSRKTGNLLSLFYKTGSPLVSQDLFTQDQAALRAQLGLPALVIEGMKLSDGTYLDGLVSYDSGVAFFIGEDGVVRKISVTAPKRTPKRKGASHAPAAQHRIAALRSRPL